MEARHGAGIFRPRAGEEVILHMTRGLALFVFAAALCAQQIGEITIEKLTGGLVFAEGPLWSMDDFLLFSDNVTGQMRKFTPGKGISEVNGPDIKSENTFDSTTVKTVQRTAKADGRKLRYSFPPHSYTMLKAKLV